MAETLQPFFDQSGLEPKTRISPAESSLARANPRSFTRTIRSLQDDPESFLDSLPDEIPNIHTGFRGLFWLVACGLGQAVQNTVVIGSVLLISFLASFSVKLIFSLFSWIWPSIMNVEAIENIAYFVELVVFASLVFYFMRKAIEMLFEAIGPLKFELDPMLKTVVFLSTIAAPAWLFWHIIQ